MVIVYSGIMRENDWEPPEPEGRSSAATKRKHVYFEQFRDSRTKRIKWISETETVSLKPDPCPHLPVSNRFEPFRASSSSSSSTSRRHNQKQNRRNGSSSDGYRKWISSSPDCSKYKDKFVLVSYNILGVQNAAKHPDLYLNIPKRFLRWDGRKKLICKEMNDYNASILCFQEVDRFSDLNDLLQKDGFKGVYKARTGEACDGCALFWKDEQFTLLHEESIEFQSFGLRNNVAQLCVLKMCHQSQSKSFMQESKTTRPQSRCLVVGNIHVLFNPARGDIKLGQVRLFIEKAYKLSQDWGSIPVILAGDLNSIPQSAVYQFLASSELNIKLHDRRNISGQLGFSSEAGKFRFHNKNMARCSVWMPAPRPLTNTWSDEELMLATGSEGITHLQHKLKLYSAYFGVPGNHTTRDNCGEPLATSYHSKFMGAVDYIWHTEELVPLRVLDTLPINILRRNVGLPNERWGSDHLALACELAFDDVKGT